jgi:hypothetical protein
MVILEENGPAQKTHGLRQFYSAPMQIGRSILLQQSTEGCWGSHCTKKGIHLPDRLDWSKIFGWAAAASETNRAMVWHRLTSVADPPPTSHNLA